MNIPFKNSNWLDKLDRRLYADLSKFISLKVDNEIYRSIHLNMNRDFDETIGLELDSFNLK